jgi:hypothetical protein
MTRLILTFASLHQVLAAEKLLRTAPHAFKCRPTSTPPGLATSICGMSIELLDHQQKNDIVRYLENESLAPEGVHEVS